MSSFGPLHTSKVPLRSVWLAKKTEKTMVRTCESTMGMCLAVETPLAWRRLTELILERRIGRQRSFFETGQMSAPDSWRSSARLMTRDVAKYDQEGLPEVVPLEARPSDAEWATCAMQALEAGVQLGTLCSKLTKKELEYR